MSEKVTILDDVLKGTERVYTTTGIDLVTTTNNGALKRLTPNGVLKGAYIAQAGEFCIDLDKALTPGVFGLEGSGILNGPDGDWGYSLLEVFQRGTTIFQRLTSPFGRMASRSVLTSGVTRPWAVLRGGGKTLLLNYLHRDAERRSAA